MGFNISSFRQILAPTKMEEKEFYVHDISGTINDGASTFTFSLDDWHTISVPVDENGNWYYDVPSGTTLYTLRRAFINKTNLTSISFGPNFDTSNVTNTTSMFSSCSSLTSVDLSNLDTSSVTNMSGMFYGCENITSLDLSSFDTHNVNNMYTMFYNCKSLTSIDISSFDTSSVTNMSGMFQYCNSFTSLDLSTFRTPALTNVQLVFDSCTSLTSLNLQNWNTLGVSTLYVRFVDDVSTLRVDYTASTFNSEIVSEFPNVNWVAH